MERVHMLFFIAVAVQFIGNHVDTLIIDIINVMTTSKSIGSLANLFLI